MIFKDGICPKCGRRCGNGGEGPLKCRCGWVDTSDKPSEVDKIMDKLFKEEFKEDE